MKRFFLSRSGMEANTNRFAPEKAAVEPQFTLLTRRAVAPDEDELAHNPRARSAKLRVGVRTGVPAGAAERGGLGLPMIDEKGRH